MLNEQVKVIRLNSTAGMIASPQLIANRTLGKAGFITNIVPGHGGDVVWVEHGDNSTAVYAVDELQIIDQPVETTKAEINTFYGDVLLDFVFYYKFSFLFEGMDGGLRIRCGFGELADSIYRSQVLPKMKLSSLIDGEDVVLVEIFDQVSGEMSARYMKED